MLGKEIIDADGIEGAPSRVVGLGLLDVITEMKPEKRLALTQATYCTTGDSVEGYEIHIGRTYGPDCDRAWLDVDGRREGASAKNGQIRGCYLHGLFTADQFRKSYLEEIGGAVKDHDYAGDVEKTLEKLAQHVEQHLDIDQLLKSASEVYSSS